MPPVLPLVQTTEWGLAVAMAVLEAKDLVHGPVEALFTIDEETGMTGAPPS